MAWGPNCLNTGQTCTRFTHQTIEGRILQTSTGCFIRILVDKKKQVYIRQTLSLHLPFLRSQQALDSKTFINQVDRTIDLGRQ